MAESAHAQVIAAKSKAYREVLARFVAAERAEPESADKVIARCRFVAHYTDDEYGEWVESAPDDSESCLQTLRTRWVDAPEAQVYLYQQDWGAATLDDGEALLVASEGWRDSVRRDLLGTLSKRYASAKQPARASELALLAARLGDGERIPLAIGQLIADGDQAGVVQLLRDTPPAPDGWQAGNRIQALLALDDPGVALTELQRYDEVSVQVRPSIAARVHLRLGDAVAASAVLENEKGDTEELRAVRFEAALATDNISLAVAQIHVQDVANIGENIQRFVVALGKHPVALFEPSMLVAAGMILVFVLIVFLAPALLLIPVHYRGLMRRADGKSLQPLFASVGLRQAWWALSVYMILPLVIGACVEPGSLAMLFGGEELPAGGAMFRIMFWGLFLCLLVFLPQLVRLGSVAVVGNRQTLKCAGWVLVAWGTLFAFAWVQNAWHLSQSVDTTTLQTKMVSELVNGGSAYAGTIGTFLLIAVLVPIVEETVFRGLLLGGMARHITFGWANFLQALLFAAIHDDPPRFIFYFVLGLFAGVLVRKYGSLAPAIALHALNNGIAFVLLMR